MSYTLYQELVDAVKTYNTSSCVIWPYACGQWGHGLVWDPRIGQTTRVARIAFEVVNGYLPPVVRHTCDNPPCFNPNHLIPGEHEDNVRDRVCRGRSAVGENNGRSKLSEEQAREIFLSENGTAALSRQYSVDGKVVRNIKRRIIWRTATDRLV